MHVHATCSNKASLSPKIWKSTHPIFFVSNESLFMCECMYKCRTFKSTPFLSVTRKKKKSLLQNKNILLTILPQESATKKNNMLTQRRIDKRLRRAVKEGASVERIRRLLNAGADRTSRDECSCTALYYAVVYGRTHLLPVLAADDMLREVIFPHAARSYTHLAIDEGRVDALKVLLQLGCDVSVQLHGFTLLVHALLKRSYACAMLLLNDYRCDVNAQAHSAAHKHPLDYVFFDTHRYSSMRELRQRDVLLRRMLQRGLDVNCQRAGWSPLNYCIAHGYNAWMKLLMDSSDVDVNATQQQNGLYPVLTAAAFGNIQALDLLIDADADMCLTSGVVTSTEQDSNGKKQRLK